MKSNTTKAMTIIAMIAFLILSPGHPVQGHLFHAEKSSVEFTEMERAIAIYAKPVASGDGDCSTWDNACTLQEAIAEAGNGWNIHVAAGTHKPTPTNDRTISFVLKDGIRIYGGFPSAGGTWSSRDWSANPTILSADIGTVGVITDNSYHVVISSGVSSDTVLDGFTITGGYTDDNGPGAYDWLGAGILNIAGSPTLSNLIITSNNSTDLSGGSGAGMYNIENSNPTLTNVTFSNNAAASGAGMYSEDSSPVLYSVIFSNNIANSSGGGMQIEGGSPTLTNVIFDHNSATGALSSGGGMKNLYNTNPILTNVAFINNSSTYQGGGMDNWNSNPILKNVTFSGNSSSYGGGINNDTSSPVMLHVTVVNNSASSFGGGIYNRLGSYPVFTNGIVWGNLPVDSQIWNVTSSVPSITYSDIEGGWEGTGNINLNPLLGPLADNGGFSMTHALLYGSPAIDSGNAAVDVSVDQRGFSRPYDGNGDGVALPDMGAYESRFSYGIYLPIVFR